MQKLILLIDDDEEEMEIMNYALATGAIGGQCIWANGAEAAMLLLKKVSPDFIFIDMNMPVVDGLTCLQQLKKNASLVNTPMVIYSTCINKDTDTKAKERGAVCCMQKPDKVETLVKQLTGFLESQASLSRLIN